MDFQDIVKDLSTINKKYLFFKEMEDLLIERISEVLEKFPQIIEQRKMYISIDLEVHNSLKNLFLKDEFTNNILLPSISILIQNFFYLVNLDKELSSHKG